MEKGCVYILKCINGRYYIGSTKNLERRFGEHSEGKVTSTKNLRPLLLVFSQEFATLAAARQVEHHLKKLKSKIILERILKDKRITFQPSGRSSAG